MTEANSHHSRTGKAVHRYNKARKKLVENIKRILEIEEDNILVNPYKGERKTGILKNVWVEKFKADKDQYLIAYEIDDNEHCVIFLSIGQHENFYRDLEKYLK